MRRNKLMIFSATFILLCRVLSVAAHRTRKAASRGMTTVRDQSLRLRKTLSRHRQGSGAADQRHNRHRPYSIISSPFSIKFRLRHPKHSRRRQGSGRPPQCWGNPVGIRSSFSSTWDTAVVPGTPSSATRSAESLTRVQHRIRFRN